jgi:hypothetical protein
MPSLCTVTASLVDPHNVAANPTVTFKLITPSPITTDDKVVTVTDYEVTAAAGALSITLIRTDQFVLPNAYYEVTCAVLGLYKHKLTLSAATFDLSDLQL